MMLDLAKIHFIRHSPQELFAALFGNVGLMSLKEVITDLSKHPELWASFCSQSHLCTG